MNGQKYVCQPRANGKSNASRSAARSALGGSQRIEFSVWVCCSAQSRSASGPYSYPFGAHIRIIRGCVCSHACRCVACGACERPAAMTMAPVSRGGGALTRARARYPRPCLGPAIADPKFSSSPWRCGPFFIFRGVPLWSMVRGGGQTC